MRLLKKYRARKRREKVEREAAEAALLAARIAVPLLIGAVAVQMLFGRPIKITVKAVLEETIGKDEEE